MNALRHGCLIALILVGLFVDSCPCVAQYTASYQTNTISGVTSNWTGDSSGYVIGDIESYDALIIENGGVLSNTVGTIGNQTGANNNLAIVSGPGSVWSNSADLIVGYSGTGNQLIITNGATVFSNTGYLCYYTQSSVESNSVLVTGTGSIWSNQSTLFIGYSDYRLTTVANGNSMTIANGGAVYSSGGNVGAHGAGADAVLVTDSGSVWYDNDDLDIGHATSSSENSLTISNGGAVFAKNVILGTVPRNAALLVTGTGSVCSVSGALSDNGGAFSLTIANGGVVYSGRAGADSDHGDSILVTDSGSVWDISGSLLVGAGGGDNIMTIAHGGVVYSTGGHVGGHGGGMLITGTGSVWSNNSDLTFGNQIGFGCAMSIDNGGGVYNANVKIEAGYVGVGVGGPGSLWNNSGNLSLGPSAEQCQLNISSGGTVVASNVYVYVALNSQNQITVSGGALYVTNALGNGVLNLSGGTLTLNGGAITANQLVLGANSVFTFTAGTLTSGGTAVTDTQLFVVGDGTDAATFQLNGGVHSFANNLEISNSASLTGCGTVNGNVVVDPGGTVLVNCGILTFAGILTNNGTIWTEVGSVLESYGPVVNNGIIYIVNGGSTNFHSTFINNGLVITTNDIPVVTAIQKVGSDIWISLKAGNGVRYVIEETTDVAGGNWTPVVGFAGTGGVEVIIDPNAAAQPKRFYRIGLLVPQPVDSMKKDTGRS